MQHNPPQAMAFEREMMIIWGAIWGALLSLSFNENAWIFGVILGAIAGLTLRKAIRTEINKTLKAAQVLAKSSVEQQGALTDKISAQPENLEAEAPSPTTRFPLSSPSTVLSTPSIWSVEVESNPLLLLAFFP
jgi:hypothetical protein